MLYKSFMAGVALLFAGTLISTLLEEGDAHQPPAMAVIIVDPNNCQLCQDAHAANHTYSVLTGEQP